jgi:hypothetical protein
MSGKRRGIPANQLARDYGVSLNEFATAVIEVMADPGQPGQPARGDVRREVCAAVSAAMALALEASTLNDEERQKLAPLLHDVLVPFWSKHCADADPADAAWITQRAAFYAKRRVEGSQVKTAVNLVQTLLESLNIPEANHSALMERLAPAFAHRMVGDVYRINEVRSKQGIEWSVLAAIGALLPLSLGYDPILRALRIL